MNVSDENLNNKTIQKEYTLKFREFDCDLEKNLIEFSSFFDTEKDDLKIINNINNFSEFIKHYTNDICPSFTYIEVILKRLYSLVLEKCVNFKNINDVNIRSIIDIYEAIRRIFVVDPRYNKERIWELHFKSDNKILSLQMCVSTLLNLSDIEEEMYKYIIEITNSILFSYLPYAKCIDIYQIFFEKVFCYIIEYQFISSDIHEHIAFINDTLFLLKNTLIKLNYNYDNKFYHDICNFLRFLLEHNISKEINIIILELMFQFHITDLAIQYINFTRLDESIFDLFLKNIDQLEYKVLFLKFCSLILNHDANYTNFHVNKLQNNLYRWSSFQDIFYCLFSNNVSDNDKFNIFMLIHAKLCISDDFTKDDSFEIDPYIEVINIIMEFKIDNKRDCCSIYTHLLQKISIENFIKLASSQLLYKYFIDMYHESPEELAHLIEIISDRMNKSMLTKENLEKIIYCIINESKAISEQEMYFVDPDLTFRIQSLLNALYCKNIPENTI